MTAVTTSAPARHDLAEVGRSAATLRTFLHGLPGVDQIGAQQQTR
jgi:deoxyribose-phosphate aldolase